MGQHQMLIKRRIIQVHGLLYRGFNYRFICFWDCVLFPFIRCNWQIPNSSKRYKISDGEHRAIRIDNFPSPNNYLYLFVTCFLFCGWYLCLPWGVQQLRLADSRESMHDLIIMFLNKYKLWAHSRRRNRRYDLSLTL